MKKIPAKTGLKKGMSRSALFLTALLMSTIIVHAQIVYSPSEPNMEEKIRFNALGSGGFGVDWDFGDGTVRSGKPTEFHNYKQTGTYRVRVFYETGDTDTVLVTVTEQRHIEYRPKSPGLNEPVTFYARNFLDKSIQWDFGDGKVTLGGATQTHAYKAPGNYTVKAVDFEGRSRHPIRTQVPVKALQPSITFDPERPRAGEPVNFTAVDFVSPSLIRWDFGDGTVISDTSPPDISHAYNHPGTYQVRAYDNAGPSVTASVSIRVYPQPALAFKPHDPRPGEEVHFRANHFFSNSLIRWDFGDGTVVNDTSPPLTAHSYANPGTYQVRAYDNGGSPLTASVVVTVWPERIITISHPQPKVKENITFRAVNFRVSAIRWDFGDGTVIEGGTAVSHAYANPGIFSVRAYDRRPGEEIPVSLSFPVVPRSGPRAPFSVSFIGLRFDDGKNYKVVPKNFKRLIAYADLKFEGTGILLAQWIVDGTPFRLVSQSLEFAGDTVIDSGNIPGLPTLAYGSHEVKLKIIEPQMDFAIPPIKYFVTGRNFQQQKVDVSLAKATSLDKIDFPISAGTIHVPSMKYFLLDGIIRNDSGVPVPYALLRVYLDEELTDQLLIKDLNVNMERAFETSVHTASPENRKLYLLLYDISEKPPVLLSAKTLELVTTEN